MLARGGNAVDAALATAITLTIVEPCSNGIGSDLFAILWDGKRSSGSTRRDAHRPRGHPRASQERRACAERGWETVTIPGAVSGWVALSERYGKLPFADLFEPAIRYARAAMRCRRTCAEKWARPTRCSGPLGWARPSCRAAGRPLPGERFASAGMARTLRRSPRRAARRSTAASSRRRWPRIRRPTAAR